MKEAKIVVHIGLPKTATTTLQTDVFPLFESGSVKYLGVHQPREDRPWSGLLRKFFEAVVSGENISALRVLLEQELSSGVSLVISEEMFTVSSNGVTWRKKLANLSKILRGLNYTIVLTVREPTSALFSYYCELYTKFKGKYECFLECALNDSDMEIYHYQKLTEELVKNFFKERIKVLCFEDIVNNRIDEIYELFPFGEKFGVKAEILRVHNEKKMKNNFIITKYSFSLGDFFRSIVSMLKVRYIPWPNKLKVKMIFVINKLDKIKLKQNKVKIPTSEEINYLRGELAHETTIFCEKFNVRLD